MYERSWRAVPLFLLSASCVMPGKPVGQPIVGAVAPTPAPVIASGVASPAQQPAPVTLPVKPVPLAATPSVEPRVAALPSAAQLAPSSYADRLRSLECLTEAVYYEARSEPLQGQRAVAQVVLNRVRHPAFPNSVCGVVFQGAERRTGCQFSFTCDGSRHRPREAAAWRRAREVAEAALAGTSDPRIGYSTHFHTNAVSPWWKRSLKLVASVGSHIFYGWKGQQGASTRFEQRYAGREPDAVVPPLRLPARASVPRIRETLAFEEDAVTVHRGPAVAAIAAVVEAPDTSAPSAVRVHRGASVALPERAAEAEAFGVKVHRSAT